MKSKIFELSFCLLLMILAHTGHSQVLISLLLGDKLNTGQIEFGLDGGLNINSQSSGGKGASEFNLGFYFDIKLKNSWMFHTGVLVKSNMGADNLPVYDLNDTQLNDLFAAGHVNRTMNYFNVPFMLKYVMKNHFYVEAGPQLGLLYGATDKFLHDVNGQPLSFEVDVRDQYRALDAGFTSGIGYRFMKGIGMNLGIRYYYGLMNVSKQGEVMNRSLYFAVGIPIGAGKAREARESSKP